MSEKLIIEKREPLRYMKRADFCDAAKEIITTDRNEQYGEPEDNFGVIAELWSAYLSNRYGEHGQFIEMCSEDVGVMMSLFKIGRMATAREAKDDNYIDAIGYLACTAEMSARRRAELERCMDAARASAEAMPEEVRE